MRKQLCDALVARSDKENMLFLTGDLGFMALEPLKEAMGARFINAGVAEQNMVTVGAALAAQDMEVWIYSIAPFMYARPFEQIRNDICFHRLPVKLIGNGGGYGYGVMGPTHHAIEDYGALLTLPGMTVFVPTFDEDVAAVVDLAGSGDGPIYLRMGRGEPPPGWPVPAYQPWRQLTTGGGPTVIGVGPIVGTYIGSFDAMPAEQRPNLWVVGALPLERNPIPERLLTQLNSSARLVVVEEHVRQGSFASQVLLNLTENGCPPRRFAHLCARAHNFGRYGSQTFLRAQSGLDPATMLSALASV
ncbi:MAG: transketolase [Acidimicrobiaceae bacterium]|jgi:transketolase|nr:transketolase [Acidimicrobiaceae bacterium]